MSNHSVALRSRDQLTASVFAGAISCGLGILYWISRVGFSNPVAPVFITTGIALFIICVPSVVSAFSDVAELGRSSRWWRGAPFIGIACVAFTAICGLAAYPTGVNAGPFIAATGVIAFLAAVFLWLRNSRFVSGALLLAFAVGMTAWVGGIAWGTRYKTPLFWEQISDRGNVHHDPLYYVSMANSMRAYGVPSTGLDGVPYTPYHYGSAWLNSQWADLAGVDVLAFYSLGPTVLMAPIFLFALLLLAAEARSAWRLRRKVAADAQSLDREVIPWIVLAGATVGLIPSSALDALGIWNRHLLISESYLTGLGIFLLCCGLAVDWWTSRDEDSPRSDAPFLLLAVPVLLICLGFLKVSLMLLALASLLWTVLRSGLWRRGLFVIASFVALIVSAITFKLVSVAAQNQGFVPFAFMRHNADPNWWPYFIVGHLFWSWLYVVLRIREENVPTLSDLFEAIRSGRLLDAEIVVVVAICGLLPGELIAIHGGSAVYFSDVQRWVAAPLTMAIAARSLDSWFRKPRNGISSIRLSTVLAVCVAIPVGLTIFFNVARAVRNAAIMNVGLRNNFAAYAGVTPARRIVRDPAVLAAGLRKAPDFAMISALRALDREPRALKRRTLLFVPQSDSAFWNIFVGEPDRCSFAPMVGPATSGLALLDGMPPASCDLTDQYGMTVYTRRTAPQTPADVAPAALCAKARRKGFNRVVILQRTGDGSYSTPVLQCVHLP